MTDLKEDTSTPECNESSSSDDPSKVIGRKRLWSSIKDLSIIALAGVSTFLLWQVRNDNRAAFALARAKRCVV
jgi:hypothetical protein